MCEFKLKNILESIFRYLEI